MKGIPSKSIFRRRAVRLLRVQCALVLALVLSAPISVGAVIVLTGDAPTDFAEANFVTDGDGIDVGTPPVWPFPFSGWDLRALYFAYDPDSDTASFGLDFFGVAGDADGDGEPGVTSARLQQNGGVDLEHLALSESIAVLFDVNQDVVQGGQFDFAVGVPSQESDNGEPLNCGVGGNMLSLSNCFGLFDVDHEALQGVATAGQVFFARRQEAVILGPFPSSGTPDLEFAIPEWSFLLAKSGVVLNPCESWSIDVHVFAGSFQDDGIGEDFFPNNGPTVTLNFPVPDGGICMCLQDLNVCEEKLASIQADADGDGTPDTIDQCPNTVASGETDLVGCSHEQFCGKFGGRGSWKALQCKAADWKNDEPIGARDCRTWRGKCVPR